jgi:uncharacterized protein (UPF0332 family)
VTEDDVRKNIADELALAESALRAAEALCDLGLTPDAASRTYYAALRAARALAFSVGIDPTSHRAAKSVLAREFVRTGRLPAERSRDLAQLEALRNAGDYDTTFALGVAEIRPDLERAHRFVQEARALLVGDGWIEPEDVT